MPRLSWREEKRSRRKHRESGKEDSKRNAHSNPKLKGRHQYM
jgi:hypothetical protein